MKHIEIPTYEPSDRMEPPVGAMLLGNRDHWISATLAELVQAYKTEAELRLTLHSIGTDPENVEAMTALASDLHEKVRYWTKVNNNHIRVSGELRVAIEALEVIASELDKALTKRRKAA